MTSDRLTRRRFLLASGAAGLLVGCTSAHGTNASNPYGVVVDDWVRVGPDGTVTIDCGRTELGQGTFTGIATLVAEELDCDLAKIRVATGGVTDRFINVEAVLNIFHPNPGFAKSPDKRDFGDWVFSGVAQVGGWQVTGGSASMVEGFLVARQAGALMREWLVAAAAAEWGVPAGLCKTAAGEVWHDGKHKPYGELVRSAAAIAPPKPVGVREPKHWKLINRFDAPTGKWTNPVRRVDIPDKVNGQAKFGIDQRLEGMRFAAIANSPVFDGEVERIDASSVTGFAVAPQVYDLKDAVAVVADSTWRAQKALGQLKIIWRNPPDPLSTADVWNALVEELGRKFGRLPGAREYRLPYLAHAAMEPMNCTAAVTGSSVDVWIGTQNQTLAQKVAAEAAGVSRDNVRIHTVLAGGGFGRRLENDLVKQAVRLARVTEKPVQVVWSREQDIQHDFYRPAAIVRIAGTMQGGRLVATRHHIASQSIIARVFPAATVWGDDQSMVEGAADMPYDIGDQKVRVAPVELRVPVGYWRSVGHSITGFANECFIDEMAHEANLCPVKFRRNMLKDKRLLALLDRVEQEAGWNWKEQASRDGTGQGVAMHLSFGSAVAMVAEVSLTRRVLKVERIVAVVDCGTVINPDIVEAQIQGSIAFGLSAALFGKITLDGGKVVERNFSDYDAVRLYQMPRVEVHIVHSQAAPGGVGEPGVPPVAPAVANAIFAASGRKLRIRSLPILDHGLSL